MQQHFEKARQIMVEGQVRPNKVTNEAVLEAIRHVPREKFLPPHLQAIAYVDEDIDLGQGRYLMEPTVLARLLQAADIRKSETVLDIGCGSGYATAVFSQLCRHVTGIDQDVKLVTEATRVLSQLGLSRAEIVQENRLQEGYIKNAPYDVIFINGSVASVPEKIKMQMADKGGRLVTVLCGKGRMGTGILITRNGDHFTTLNLFDAATPALPGFEEKKTFIF